MRREIMLMLSSSLDFLQIRTDCPPRASILKGLQESTARGCEDEDRLVAALFYFPCFVFHVPCCLVQNLCTFFHKLLGVFSRGSLSPSRQASTVRSKTKRSRLYHGYRRSAKTIGTAVLIKQPRALTLTSSQEKHNKLFRRITTETARKSSSHGKYWWVGGHSSLALFKLFLALSQACLA